MGADAEGSGEGDAGGEEGGDGANGETAKPALKNSDFRNALLPFLSRPPEVHDERGGKKRDGGKPKRRRDDDSDDDAEPPPPLSLNKSDAAGAAAAGGLVLRKTKGADKKRSKSGPSSVKIKF